MMKIQAQRKNVTKEVCENVKKFLLKELPNYTVIDIVDRSKHHDDNYLFMVVGKKVLGRKIGTYAVWTCWNEKTQSLNFGHYDLDDLDDLDDLEECEKIIQSIYL